MADPLAVHDAYVAGDLSRLLDELGHPDGFPNQQASGPPGIAEIPLEYAIYWSPFGFIEELLDLGADPNYEDHAGFPSLIATLTADRSDQLEVLELLLDRGADIEQRGVNDYTPLHWAAAANHVGAVELLLARRADHTARTRIDDCTTPLQEADAAGATDAARVLRELG